MNPLMGGADKKEILTMIMKSVGDKKESKIDEKDIEGIDESDESLSVIAAKSLIKAVMSKDVKLVIKAFKALQEACCEEEDGDDKVSF